MSWSGSARLWSRLSSLSRSNFRGVRHALVPNGAVRGRAGSSIRVSRSGGVLALLSLPGTGWKVCSTELFSEAAAA